MRVRAIKTGEEFFIKPEDAFKIGKDKTVAVYDHEPQAGGCRHSQIGALEIWDCGREPSKPIKKFRGNFLEVIRSAEALEEK